MSKRFKGAILEGMPAIGKYVNRHPITVFYWIHKFGLPAMKSPKGRWMTSTTLIDGWIAKQTLERLNGLEDVQRRT